VADGSTPTAGSIEVCGVPTGSEVAFWDATQWEHFSSQSYSAGCVTGQVSNSTTPTIAQVVGATTWVAAGSPVTATSTSVLALPSSSETGQTVMYTATVNPNPVSGTVAFYDDGSPISGCSSQALATGGVATCSSAPSPARDHIITATYSGDASDGTSSGTVTLPVGPAITSSAFGYAVNGTAFSFTVTTAGAPVPSLKEIGKLPKGLRFHNNGNGTATIAGTPIGAAVKNHALTLRAVFGKGKKRRLATQPFTLVIAG
jgi:hypothetical protein